MHATVFVTAATGTTGRLVAEALLRRGALLRAGVRHGPDAALRSRCLPRGARPVPVDLLQPSTLPRALAGADAVCHATPFTPAMVTMTANLLRAAREAGVGRLVTISAAAAACGEPGRLASWHRQVERLVEDSGLDWTIVRPVSLMQTFATVNGHPIRTQSQFFDAVGGGRVSYVDGRDVAEVVAEVLTAPGHAARAYTVTGPEALSNQEAADILSRQTGREIRYIEVDAHTLKIDLLANGRPREMVEAILELNAAMRRDRFADVAPTVKALTGHPPRSFSRYVADHATAFA